MEILRAWAMPNSNTFDILPIRKLIEDELTAGVWIDPFANKNKLASITNDLNPDYDTDYHLDALQFMKMFEAESIDGVLYDPPCAKWMDETNWWTADEAKENGFVDEVDDEEDAVVENRGGILFVNSIGTHLPFNEAPEFVRNRAKAKKPAARPENKTPAEQPEHDDHGEVKDMEIKTVDDLRKVYPDMVAQIENDAATAERTRIKEIEDSTLPGAEDEANEAKFVKPVDSAAFAKAMIANMKAKQNAQGKDYLDKAKKSAQNSGANDIQNPPPADPEPEDAQKKCLMNAIHKMNGVK